MVPILRRMWPYLLVAIGVASAAGYEGRVSSKPLPGVLKVLLAPGTVGFMLVGGVHGGLSDSVQVLAWAVTNGLFWAVLVWVFVSAANKIR